MRVHDDIIKIQSNELIEIRLGKYIFSDKLFILVIICNLARDVISFVIEITINIILMLIMISYYKKRLTINISNPIFLERKRTDIKIALLMNFISVLFRLMFFSVIIILVLYFPFYLRITLKVLILLFSLRHSLNFFLFLRFNKKFRRDFYMLIPDCILKLQTRRRSPAQVYFLNQESLNSEHVNTCTITTHL